MEQAYEINLLTQIHSKDKITQSHFSLIPSWIQLTVSIQTKEEVSDVEILITDINGKPVGNKYVAIKDQFGQTQIDVRELQSGMYFIKMSTGNIHQSVARFIRVE